MLKFVKQLGRGLLGFHGLHIYLTNKIENMGQNKGCMEMLE